MIAVTALFAATGTLSYTPTTDLFFVSATGSAASTWLVTTDAALTVPNYTGPAASELRFDILFFRGSNTSSPPDVKVLCLSGKPIRIVCGTNAGSLTLYFEEVTDTVTIEGKQYARAQ